MLSPVSFADVVNRTSTVVHEDEEEDLTRRASANEGWKSCDNSRNLWLDTLDDDCLSSDEDQNDSSNYSERNVRLKKDRFSSSSSTLHCQEATMVFGILVMSQWYQKIRGKIYINVFFNHFSCKKI